MYYPPSNGSIIRQHQSPYQVMNIHFVSAIANAHATIRFIVAKLIIIQVHKHTIGQSTIIFMAGYRSGGLLFVTKTPIYAAGHPIDKDWEAIYVD